MEVQMEKYSLGIKDAIIHFVDNHDKDLVVVRIHCYNEE